MRFSKLSLALRFYPYNKRTIEIVLAEYINIIMLSQFSPSNLPWKAPLKESTLSLGQPGPCTVQVHTSKLTQYEQLEPQK